MTIVILYIIILIGIVGAVAFLNLHKQEVVEDGLRAGDFEIFEMQ